MHYSVCKTFRFRDGTYDPSKTHIPIIWSDWPIFSIFWCYLVGSTKVYHTFQKELELFKDITWCISFTSNIFLPGLPSQNFKLIFQLQNLCHLKALIIREKMRGHLPSKKSLVLEIYQFEVTSPTLSSPTTKQSESKWNGIIPEVCLLRLPFCPKIVAWSYLRTLCLVAANPKLRRLRNQLFRQPWSLKFAYIFLEITSSYYFTTNQWPLSLWLQMYFLTATNKTNLL